MSRRRWFRVAPALAAAAFLFASPAPARVYQLLGPALHGATTADQPGWPLAYRAAVRLNGGRGDLEVLGCQFDAREAARQLRAVYGARGAVWLRPGRWLTWGLARVDDRVVRLLVLDVGRAAECVVVRLVQTRDEFLRSGRPAAESALPDLPDLPGALREWSAADDSRRLAVEVSRAGAADPGQAQRELDEAWVGAGWVPVLPPDPNGGPRAAQVFMRDGVLAAAQVTPAPDGRGVTIVRLRKAPRGGE